MDTKLRECASELGQFTRSIKGQNLLRETALSTAAKHFTHDEYLELEGDIDAGRVDIRLYEDGLVLMRVGA